MTTPDASEYKICPGWDAITGEHRKCQPMRGGPPNLIHSNSSGPCPRCRKAKHDYDDAHGARERATAEAMQRKAERNALYDQDMAEALQNIEIAQAEGQLHVALRAVATIPTRSSLPPYEPQERTPWNKSFAILDPSDQIAILRRFVGLPDS